MHNGERAIALPPLARKGCAGRGQAAPSLRNSRSHCRDVPQRQLRVRFGAAAKPSPVLVASSVRGPITRYLNGKAPSRTIMYYNIGFERGCARMDLCRPNIHQKYAFIAPPGGVRGGGVADLYFNLQFDSLQAENWRRVFQRFS